MQLCNYWVIHHYYTSQKFYKSTSQRYQMSKNLNVEANISVLDDFIGTIYGPPWWQSGKYAARCAHQVINDVKGIDRMRTAEKEDSSQPVFRYSAGQPVNGSVMLLGLFGHGEDRERQRGGRLADRLCKDEWVREEHVGEGKLFPQAVKRRRRQERLRASVAGHVKREFGAVLVSDQKSFSKRFQKERWHEGSDAEEERTKGSWMETEAKLWFSRAEYTPCT